MVTNHTADYICPGVTHLYKMAAVSHLSVFGINYNITKLKNRLITGVYNICHVYDEHTGQVLNWLQMYVTIDTGVVKILYKTYHFLFV